MSSDQSLVRRNDISNIFSADLVPFFLSTGVLKPSSSSDLFGGVLVLYEAF